MSKEFSPSPVLLAREARWHARQQLVRLHGSALVSATLRLPQALRQQPAYVAAFHRLCRIFDRQLEVAGGKLVLETMDADGPARHYAISDARLAKQLAIAMEEHAPGGGMLDLDVLDPAGTPLSRSDLGEPPRPCVVCGGRPAAACVAGERHSLSVTCQAFEGLLREMELPAQPEAFIADCARQALIYEALLSPKPGLVDRLGTGAHSDMDIYCFVDSALALGPGLLGCARLGARGDIPADQLLARLRPVGIQAEQAMLQATGGVNTHRGAIFSLGILCAAAARLGSQAGSAAICALAGQIAAPALLDQPAHSHGGLAQRLYGAAGARGEAAAGFPNALSALARLGEGLAAGQRLEAAALTALYHTMGRLRDSNVLFRGGEGGLAFMHSNAQRLLEEDLPRQGMLAFGAQMAARGLSPGGCADVLAQALFLHLLQDNGANVTN